MSALQLHSPQAALTSVLSSLDIWSLVCAQMADGNDMVQALASYPTVQAAARQIGASTAAQAAAEAACEAGRGPVVPVVRQERLKSFDSARRTAGVLPCGRVLNEPPADVRRRFVRCRRDLAAIAKLVRAPGPSCITLSGGLAPVCRVERGRSEWVSRLEPRSIEIVAKPRTSMPELIEATSV
jgi:hypothetical protein